MIPRQGLDIGWADLLYGFGSCLRPLDRDRLVTRIEQDWAEHSLVCLSVRSGFDALLHSLNFPPGSEILVSALTIQGMIQIIEAHNLVAIPLDLNIPQISPHPQSLTKALSPQTKAILVAHLFGDRMDLEPILQVAQAHNLVLIEDCAQACRGDDYRGHPHSDISLFSFGPIKTATALGGGLLRFRDPSLGEAVRQHQATWPIQSRWTMVSRIGKYSLLVLLSYRPLYSLFVALCHRLNVNHDRLISNSVRGFPGDRFFEKIRQRPNAPLLALLNRRLQHFNRQRIADRCSVAQQAITLMPHQQRPGNCASDHSHWVFPILHDHPDALIEHLWHYGFDATRGGSSLSVVQPPSNRPSSDRLKLRAVDAEYAFQRLVYLPIYRGISTQDLERLAIALSSFLGDSSQQH